MGSLEQNHPMDHWEFALATATAILTILYRDALTV
jgi:hypothetical protein